MPNAWELDVAEAAQAIRAGDITAESLAASLVAKTEANADLSAFVKFKPDAILESARNADLARKQGKALGRLHGVPICLKDNIDALGYATTACTPALAENMPRKDAPIVAALRREGAVIFGKNTMHELAFGITSNNTAFGAVRNPYNPHVIPGGSSGGTAVAVAARLAPAGIGTDTGGSIRLPAALCGVSGLRPTLRRWAQEGIVPIASTRDTAGPIARSVSDLRILDSVAVGDADEASEIDLRRVRLGVPRKHFWENLESHVETACFDALKDLSALGITLVDVDLRETEAANQAVSLMVALYEPRIDIPAYLRHANSGITLSDIVRKASNPDVRHIMQGLLDEQTQVSSNDYFTAIGTHRPRLVHLFEDCFAREGVDATIFPTSPLSARPIGDDETVELNGRRLPTFATFIRNTDPGSNAGLPGVSFPIGLTPTGLPIGLAMDGPAGSDRRLLAIAARIAEHIPRIPAPCVRSG
jgi:Asp-tRNA(Asn)/Glu-tRNA(Gln) amidotransferase A subunit family amidase